jgi:hypothetical protein
LGRCSNLFPSWASRKNGWEVDVEDEGGKAEKKERKDSDEFERESA